MKYGKTPDYFYETKIDNDVIEGFAKTLLDMGSAEDILGNLDSLEELVDFDENFGFNPVLDTGDQLDDAVEEEAI